MSFDLLAEAATIHFPAEPIVQFERRDYRTPSGKMELAGSNFVGAGLPSAPFPSAEARPPNGELRLLSPASNWLMNSSFGNDPKVLKQLGEDRAFMYPDEARSRSLADGGSVRLQNQTGAITVRLAFRATCREASSSIHKSRWTANGAANSVNALNPGKKADLAESCAVHSINVSAIPA